MQHLTRTARQFDRRIFEYWLYPVRIGVAVTICAILGILFPILEVSFTRTTTLKYFARNEQYAVAALLFGLLLLACIVPYWGGVVCTLLVCVLRMTAYAQPFNLTAWAVYGGVIMSTVFSVRKQYVLSRWVVEMKERCDAQSSS